MIIDAHAHFVPAALLEKLSAERGLFPSIAVQNDGGGARFAFCGQAPTRPVSPRLSDAAQRKTWLASRGIDRQVIGGWLDMFGYELPPEEGADWCRLMNQHMADAAAKSGIFASLATVPMQNGKLAARVLEEALALGLSGVMIGTQPKGVGGALDDPDLDPFWEVVSARRVTVFVHPMLACCDDRLNSYDLVNSIGRVIDTTTAVARLLCSGHMQRFAGVNLLIAHGGAALPYVLGRLQASHVAHKGKDADPTAGFGQLFFDTVLFEPRGLRFLRDMAGADKILLGSDHPFALGDDWPCKIAEQAGFSEDESRAILGDTAARLFHIQ